MQQPPLTFTNCELCEKDGWQLNQDADLVPWCTFKPVESVQQAKQIGRRLSELLFPEAYPKPKPKNYQVGESIFERVRSAYRIEDVAHKLTNLYGSKTLSGKCPFHNERTGRAFVVWVETQTWKCNGKCQDGGDVISLVRKAMEGGLW